LIKAGFFVDMDNRITCLIGELSIGNDVE